MVPTIPVSTSLTKEGYSHLCAGKREALMIGWRRLAMTCSNRFKLNKSICRFINLDIRSTLTNSIKNGLFKKKFKNLE